MPETTWAATRVGLTSPGTRGKHHEGGRTERDERIGPEPGQALAPLALKANGCSEQQPNHKVER